MMIVNISGKYKSINQNKLLRKLVKITNKIGLNLLNFSQQWYRETSVSVSRSRAARLHAIPVPAKAGRLMPRPLHDDTPPQTTLDRRTNCPAHWDDPGDRQHQVKKTPREAGPVKADTR